MATIRRFEDLEVWQEARRFVSLIDRLCAKQAFRRDFELIGQMRRSAVSVMANIAEGFHRDSKKEFVKFFDYPRSSIAETLSHCYVALDQGYIQQADMEQIRATADTVWKKVNKLITYLSTSSGLKEGRIDQ